MKQRLMYLFIFVMFVSLSTGCASKYGAQETEVHYYPACYDPIKKLRDEEAEINKATAAGALGGFLVGITGGILSGKPESAIASTVLGTAFGAVVSNQIAKTRQIKNQNQRMAAYIQNINGNVSNLDIQTVSAKNALQCYEQQFKLLMKAIKRKQVTQEEAKRMFAEIESGTREATRILGVLEDNSRDMEKQYRAALATEEQDLQKSGKKQSRSKARKTRTDLRKVQNSCDSIQTTTKKINSQKIAAEQRLLAQQMELKASFAEAEA